MSSGYLLSLIHARLTKKLPAEGMWYQGESIEGFRHVSAYKHGDIVMVWLVTLEGKALTIEDEWALFPSDTFVTQLRLLGATCK